MKDFTTKEMEIWEASLRALARALETKNRREYEPWNPAYGGQVDSIKSAVEQVNLEYEQAKSFLSQSHIRLIEHIEGVVREMKKGGKDNKLYINLQDVDVRVDSELVIRFNAGVRTALSDILTALSEYKK